jgi:hypothetical protein
MAISVAWTTHIITIPKADTTLVSAGPPEIRSYDINEFRGELMAAHASRPGAYAQTPYAHSVEELLSGVLYARKVKFLPPYKIEFENGNYTVYLTGANHNFADVHMQNSVGIVVNNSAGLINSGGGSVAETAAAVWEELRSAHTTPGSFGEALDAKISDIPDAVLDDPRFAGEVVGALYYIMEAWDSVTGGFYTWVSPGVADWTGTLYPGPNSPTNVAIFGKRRC